MTKTMDAKASTEKNTISKTELTTTLEELKKHGAMEERDFGDSGYKKLLNYLGVSESNSALFPLQAILKCCGIKNAIWALRTVDKKYENAIRLFACHCAKPLLPCFEDIYPNDMRPRNAVELAEKYAQGEEIIWKTVSDARKDVLEAINTINITAYNTRTDHNIHHIIAYYVAANVAHAAVYITQQNISNAIHSITDYAAKAAALVTITGAVAAACTTVECQTLLIDAFTTSWDSLTTEFQKLCRLEGKYWNVLKIIPNTKESVEEKVEKHLMLSNVATAIDSLNIENHERWKLLENELDKKIWDCIAQEIGTDTLGNKKRAATPIELDYLKMPPTVPITIVASIGSRHYYFWTDTEDTDELCKVVSNAMYNGGIVKITNDNLDIRLTANNIAAIWLGRPRVLLAKPKVRNERIESLEGEFIYFTGLQTKTY
jgi:hypothetical protein